MSVPPLRDAAGRGMRASRLLHWLGSASRALGSGQHGRWRGSGRRPSSLEQLGPAAPGTANQTLGPPLGCPEGLWCPTGCAGKFRAGHMWLAIAGAMHSCMAGASQTHARRQRQELAPQQQLYACAGNIGKLVTGPCCKPVSKHHDGGLLAAAVPQPTCQRQHS